MLTRRLTISTRLALWYALSATLLLGLVVAFLYTGFHLTLHRDFDADLDGEAARVARAVMTSPNALAAFEKAASGSPYAVRLVLPSGRVAAANARLPSLSVHAPVDEGTHRLAWVRPHSHGPDGVRTRFAPLPSGGWVAAAGVESGLHREMHRLGWLLALGVALGAVVAAVSGYGLARRALQPVASLTDAARRIGPAEQGARLPTGPEPHDELGHMAEAFNGLLARLDAALERERRFRADAAHELFSPVTAARSEVEVALRRERSPEAYRDALGRLGRHVERMAGLVTGLLALSQAEADDSPAAETVDLGALAESVAERARPAALAKHVSLEVDTAPGVAGPAGVAVALENLLDNALKYTPPGGRVVVSVRTEGGEAVVEVSDTGAGFADPERDRLFERFFRSDAPEIQAERGHGLGLAVAQRLVERHGGRVTAASAGPGTGSMFAIRLPTKGTATAKAAPVRENQ